jgi:hypothetical protein
MKRRTYLSGVATALALSSFMGKSSHNSTVLADPADNREPTYMLLEGTQYETGVYVIDAPESGPTAIVVGGMHGDERSGYRAAKAVTDWQFDAGQVVVLPAANRPALERGTRHGVHGDLNRKFPPEEEPTTRLAQAIWNNVVLQHDPDLLMDLHRSKGIYKFHQSFVGQAIYPTDIGNAPSNAVETVELLNEEYVPWYMPYHDFKRGNILYGTNPMLAHKFGEALEQPAYIVETTTFLTDLDTRVEWTKGAAEKLLSLHGIERTKADSNHQQIVARDERRRIVTEDDRKTKMKEID